MTITGFRFTKHLFETFQEALEIEKMKQQIHILRKSVLLGNNKFEYSLSLSFTLLSCDIKRS